tara:strand:+ start:167 stop:1771 length:1605 start_codon:yes stop_codon:yes gene_type:complete
MPSFLDFVLEINNLFLRYSRNESWILNDLSLKLARGERMALVGPSGSGKSSLAKVLLQLMPEGSEFRGSFCLDGIQSAELDELNIKTLRAEKVGLIFQDPMTRLNPLMTIGDHLIDNFKAHLPHKSLTWMRTCSEQLMEKVGISASRFNSYPHEISGGMRQRIAIALAISMKPPLIIADEPTTSLDVLVADKVMAELNDLCHEIDSSLILITHDLALASRWCPQMAIMEKGKIIESGNTKDLLLFPKSEIAKRLVKCSIEREFKKSEGFISEEFVLDVSSLRCWHPLENIPWNSKWIKAVDEISFSILEGEILGVVGSSGCGKSTLCRALMGLEKVRGGDVKMYGKSIFDKNGQISTLTSKSLQLVFQDSYSSLNPKMTIGESIADPLLIHKISSLVAAKEQVRDILNIVGLNPPEIFQNRYPNQLSGGQLQRVVIARALILQPKLLICDESLSMLDSEIQLEILSLLSNLQRKLRLSILFITHDLILAAGFCDRIIVLDKGKIIEENYSTKLLNEPQEEITKKLVKSCPRIPK